MIANFLGDIPESPFLLRRMEGIFVVKGINGMEPQDSPARIGKRSTSEGATVMGTPYVTVSHGRITIDSEESIRTVLDDCDTAGGSALDKGLELPNYGDVFAYAVPASTVITRNLFRPGKRDFKALDWRNVELTLRDLEESEYLTTHDVWHEGSHQAYLDEGRGLTLVEVTAPFVVVSVRYGSWGGPDGYSHHWKIEDQTAVITPGHYLAGFFGDYRWIYVGAAQVETGDTDVLLDWLAGLEGFTADRCQATCDACEASWLAEAGSQFRSDWEFQPEYGVEAEAWDFDDADDFDDDDTIACPNCANGRVGFMVY